MFIDNYIVYNMGFCQSVNRTQLINLLSGMLGIYILYFIAGILHESLVKRPHYNRVTKNYQICDNALGLLFVPFLIAWLMGQAYNHLMLAERVQIPHKNSAITAGSVFIATIFSILAIQRTSFPLVVMFESCSILPVVFIGVFCSRVHDPNLKLGPKKIVVALIITAGILLFQFADPETKQRETKEQFIGILFLIFHFVAEGFLPDLQAQIKINFKPSPTQMMADINKWASLYTLVLAILTLNAWSFAVFMWEHLQFTVELVIMSIASGFGQFFVYRMIKQFKQHFVPFTISSRKILTVAISIVFYNHKTNWIQILGISIVLFTVFVEFMTQLSTKQQKQAEKENVVELNQQKIEENIKSNFDVSDKSSKEGDKKTFQDQLEVQEKTIERQNKKYQIKMIQGSELNQQQQKKQQRSIIKSPIQKEKDDSFDQENQNQKQKDNRKDKILGSEPSNQVQQLK